MNECQSYSSRSELAAATAQGEPLSPPLLAPLRDSSDVRDQASECQARLAMDGYLYLPAFFTRDDVLSARRDVFGRLAAVGEVADPPENGVVTGTSRRDDMVADRGSFWRSVSETWTLRRLSHGRPLHELMDRVLGEPSAAQDYLFLRPAGPGKSTHLHCDYPFFTRNTEAVATAWIALGDVPLHLGPLFVVEGSHCFDDMIESYRGFDVARDTARKAALPQTPQGFATSRGARLLSNDFHAGDIVIFGMFLLHGSLDNVSSNGIRLSCDVRYQIACADRDPRYFGPDPTGTTGAGYAELIGAKPLTEPWHIR